MPTASIHIFHDLPIHIVNVEIWCCIFIAVVWKIEKREIVIISKFVVYTMKGILLSQNTKLQTKLRNYKLQNKLFSQCKLSKEIVVYY